MGTDHKTIEEFVRALANATEYKTHPLGYSDNISNYWKQEAELWVLFLDEEKAKMRADARHLSTMAK